MSTQRSGSAEVAEVRVLPLEDTIQVRPGETILDAAERHGLKWPTVCHGEGACTVCYLRVEVGAEVLGEVTDLERQALAGQLRKRVQRQPGVYRLACQATVEGAATFVRRGVGRVTSA